MHSQIALPMAKVLIVEDEIFVAADLEATLEELGYQPVGIAADRQTALALADTRPDIALVDLNLRDGETGVEIGERLGAKGVAVVFVTANPRSLGRGVSGTLGVISKPAEIDTIKRALSYACDRLRGGVSRPPADLYAFS
jgi:two-component system, response regulator PdtaR